MSGIAGIIHFDGAPVGHCLIESMTSAMASRGPDGIAHYSRGSVALGQCMLRTTPESLEEHQPLTSEEENLALVMDGRVDNWEDLRRQLLACGAVLRDRSDAELILRSYEIWGEECPDRIVGEFVFFIWDARRRRLFGARDAAGTRHFYYHAGNGWFAFASEIKGLLALERIKLRLNESALLDYLTLRTGSHDEIGTFYQDINRLPAGHAMRSTAQGVKKWRYWDPGNLPALPFASLNECAEGFLEQLRIAVKCRLRSIGPVGSMLSGGLDSSSIVGLISKEFRSDLAHPLRTFSLIRADQENCMDWLSIQKILRDAWIEPIILTSSIAAERSRSYLENTNSHDEPFALSQGFTQSLVYEAALENGCRVVLDGMAGDLLFYSPELSLRHVIRTRRFREILPILAAFRRHGIETRTRKLAWKSLHSAVPEKLLGAYGNLRRKYKGAGEKLPEPLADRCELLNKDATRRYLKIIDSTSEADRHHLSHGDDRTMHARTFTSGALSVAHEIHGQTALSIGVEPRSPFSDRRIIEFAVQMPLEAKLSASWYKVLLRNSMAGILPDEVRWRRDWGGNPGWKFYEQLISAIARNGPEYWNCSHLNAVLEEWIDPQKFAQAWADYQNDADFDIGYKIFVAAVLAKWMSNRYQRV